MQDIESALKIPELRQRFLEHTKRAYQRLPALEAPRILDVGCGAGTPTIALARLSQGTVVGIDTDAVALAQLREKIEQPDFSLKVSTLHCSLDDTPFPPANFDIVWAEGVLHLLDLDRSFQSCHQLLKPSGFLVVHETLRWFAEVRDRVAPIGFSLFDTYEMPKHCWWTDYGAPLAERIKEWKEKHPNEAAQVSRYEQEARMLEQQPERFDCAFCLFQKTT